MNNTNLKNAKITKNDEFYTQLSDIEKELQHYAMHFNNKVVYCNCDNPYTSNFFQYFLINFTKLGLKKLLATCYAGPASDYKAYTACSLDGTAYIVTELKGDGSFDSDECVEILDTADIVCSNPPFSQFSHYLQTIISHQKSFLLIGSQNNITYKNIWPLFLQNKLWLGVTKPKEYIQPDGTLKKFGNTCWYTNLDTQKRHKKIQLTKHYDPTVYPTYDNYPAINVDRVSDIPCDYSGIMGIPISFLDKYNPEQFEIINLGRHLPNFPGLSQKFVDDCFAAGSKSHIHAGHPDLGYYTHDGKPVVPYMRLLVHNKHPKS